MTRLPRTVVGWEGRGGEGRGGLVIYSNVSLCSVLVLPPPAPRAACTSAVRGPAEEGKRGGKKAKRGGDERKKRAFLPVTAVEGSKKKGRKAQLPHLNAPQGGVRRAGVGEEGYEPTMLQIYSGRAVRAPSCSFLQPVKTNCCSVSIISLLCHGPEVCSFFLFGPANHFFPVP